MTDVGTMENGAPYLVMEHLDGQNLAQLLADGGRLAIPFAVEVVLQACEAVAEAHAHGTVRIVHRDIKPSNLFLTHHADGSPCVKVGGANGSAFAAHTSGKGFIARGAEIRLPLNAVSNQYEGSFNASAYSGISFWAKSKTVRDIYVNVADRNRYTAAGVGTGTSCGDDFGDGLQIGTTWAKTSVKFATMSPDVAGGSATVGKSHIYGIEFHVAPKNDAGTGAPFDVWIDEVAFIA